MQVQLQLRPSVLQASSVLQLVLTRAQIPNVVWQAVVETWLPTSCRAGIEPVLHRPSRTRACAVVPSLYRISSS